MFFFLYIGKKATVRKSASFSVSTMITDVTEWTDTKGAKIHVGPILQGDWTWESGARGQTHGASPKFNDKHVLVLHHHRS